MPRHDVKCECGHECEIFIHARQLISDQTCEKCGEKRLSKVWTPDSKPIREREWEGRKSMSHEFRFPNKPEVIAAARKRMGGNAARMIQDDGSVWHSNRRESREFQRRVVQLQRQDAERRAQHGD